MKTKWNAMTKMEQICFVGSMVMIAVLITGNILYFTGIGPFDTIYDDYTAWCLAWSES